MAIGVLLQAIYSLWMIWTVQTSQQLGVVTGQVSRENYQAATVAFYKPAQAINLLTGTIKIALYDEVFGYFLNKPYMWANPGHSTLIPYETTESGEKFAVEMKRLGFTHAYVNLQMIDRDFKSRWITAMSDSPFSPEERTQMRSDPNLWWRVLFADAVREGKIKIVKTFPEGAEPRSVLFEFTR